MRHRYEGRLGLPVRHESCRGPTFEAEEGGNADWSSGYLGIRHVLATLPSQRAHLFGMHQSHAHSAQPSVRPVRSAHHSITALCVLQA